jgi:hypothetical protein
MEWSALLSALLVIIGLILKEYVKAKEKREANSDDINIQAERRALQNNDGPAVDAAVADQHDRVSKALGYGRRRTDDHRQEINP